MTSFIGQSRTYQENDALHSVGTPEEDLLMTHISGGEPLQISLLELQRPYSCMPVQVSPPHSASSAPPRESKGTWGGEEEMQSLQTTLNLTPSCSEKVLHRETPPSATIKQDFLL